MDRRDKPYKVVVFDMDETLGYFPELGIFWDALSQYISQTNASKKLTQLDFNDLLNLFPEFLRPNILNILENLKKQKETGICQRVMIYTNNIGPKSWTIMIKNYFDMKLNYPLFDRAIGGKKVEPLRTTDNKTVKDLILCSGSPKIPETSEICFLDDLYHPDMDTENVCYINLKPYSFSMPYEMMIQRYMHSPYFNAHITSQKMEKFFPFMMSAMKKYNYITLPKFQKEYDVDKIISKKIMQEMNKFYNNTWRENRPSQPPSSFSRVRSITPNTIHNTPHPSHPTHKKQNGINMIFT